MTLAEIVAEAERLESDVQSAIDLRMPTLADVAIGLLHDFYAEHGRTFLAVAKAAVEHAPQIEGFCREAEATPRPPGGQQAGMDRSWARRVPPSVIGEIRWYARGFRELLAAVRGADEGGNDGQR